MGIGPWVLMLFPRPMGWRRHAGAAPFFMKNWIAGGFCTAQESHCQTAGRDGPIFVLSGQLNGPGRPRLTRGFRSVSGRGAISRDCFPEFKHRFRSRE